MKSEEEVKAQLVDVYEHRLALRIERKTKHACRNCKNAIKCEFDFGDFGAMSKWVCKDGKTYNEGCGFDCVHTQKEIEDEMLQDISDPAICGAKEPKIAMLMWVLHNVPKCENEGKCQTDVKEKADGILSTIKGWFSK